MRVGLIGNPENRRVSGFLQVCQEARFPPPRVCTWETLLENPEAPGDWLDQVDYVRIESPGENARVTSGCIALGGGPRNAVIEPGEIIWQKEFHLGFCRLLESLSGLPFRWVNPPDEIACMFDKWQTHQRCIASGVPRPASRLAPASVAEFRATRGTKGRCFLKPLHGSSGSGVCALRWDRDREHLIAPIEVTGVNGSLRLFNSLRIRSYEDPHEISTILGRLLPQAMIQEQWISKAPLAGGRVDFRVLVLAGRPCHHVVRHGTRAITNLHLGNRRIALEEFVATHGEAALDAILRTAEMAALCFPKSLSMGVDILPDRQGRAWLGEINAFGDLLPNLTHEGRSAYASTIATMAETLHAPTC